MQLDISPKGASGVTTVENVEHFEIESKGVFVETEDGEMRFRDYEVYGGGSA